MNSIKFKPTTEEVIGETIGFIVVTGLQGWALVSFFSLTWGQALVRFKQELRTLYKHLENIQNMKTNYLSGR